MRYVKSFVAAFAITLATAGVMAPESVAEVKQAAIDFGDEIWIIITPDLIVI